MRHVERLLIAYLLLKPLYLFESGGLQIADLCLLAAFVLFIILTKFDLKAKNSLISVVKSNALFLVFIAMTFIVNLTYFAHYGKYKFILSSLYFVFTFVAILMFAIFCQKRTFLDKMSTAFKFGLIAQVIIFVLGVGRYYSPDRYMGSFNDPNQFAFFILLSYLFIYAINALRGGKENSTIYLVVTAGLIYVSASTGMLLGLSAFLLGQLLYSMLHFKLQYRTVKHIVYGVTSATIMVAAVLLIASTVTTSSSRTALINKVGTVTIADRLEQKTVKAGGGADMTLWEERGYDKIYKYPEKLIYGAGEGMYERFNTKLIGEIHATLPSILFYYGIVPFLILLKWLYTKIRKSAINIQLVYFSLLAESFTLLNQRQTLFWIIFVLGSMYTKTIRKGSAI